MSRTFPAVAGLDGGSGTEDGGVLLADASSVDHSLGNGWEVRMATVATSNTAFTPVT